jgi:hypothetical protein
MSSASDKKERLLLTRTSAAFGLPLDAKTVELELYLAISGLPHDIHFTAYPYSPITGNCLLPIEHYYVCSRFDIHALCCRLPSAAAVRPVLGCCE